MTTVLSFEWTENGVIFKCADETRQILIENWALCESLLTATGSTAHVGVLLRLREDELADDVSSYEVRISHLVVSQLLFSETRGLGLPPFSSMTLEIQGSGSLSDPDFHLAYGFLQPDGRRAVAVNRFGVLLKMASEEFLLSDPLYSIVEEIDRFNSLSSKGLEQKFLAWGQLRERLPEEVVVDDHLKGIRIAVASTFSIIPFTNNRGEPDFDANLGRWRDEPSNVEEDYRKFEEVLPLARQADFARRFRALVNVKHRYSVGANTFVVLAPSIERVLRAVKKAQSGNALERRQFLENPSLIIREALETNFDKDLILDEIFCDEGLSDRVKGVGIWQPKVLPWIQRASEPWLPPEELGIRVGDHLVQINRSDVVQLLDEIREARVRGETLVVYQGNEIPASEEAEHALSSLLPIFKPDQKLGKKDQEEEEKERSDQSLLIVDNFEVVGYEGRTAAKRGRPGGIPAVLESDLLPHQKEGLLWLQKHWSTGSPGALLADDMGLGKTLEALTFLAWLVEEMEQERATRRPLMVVAPTGLLQNWKDEHDKHLSSPGLGNLLEAYGGGLRQLRKTSGTKIRELDTGFPTLELKALERADWVMTTYETLRDYQHSFARVHWAAIVFDEAHKIKNPTARITDAALAMNADIAITMTGTPVENRPADIWTIVDRAQPGQLGSLKEFSKTYESGGNGESEKALASLRDQLVARNTPPIMLRRLKEDHLKGLPEKVNHVRPVEMLAVQADVYKAAVNSSHEGESVLSVLQKLRSISLHPYSPGGVPTEQYISESARVRETFSILDQVVDRKEKVLVFVEIREMQNFLMEAIQRRYHLQEPVLVINGAISGKKRKERIDTFQVRRGFDVMLLSPKAGGVGLTLTAANHVIHLSRWWNPAVEDQCTDRVFRIGQNRRVHIYYPVARHPVYGDYSFDVKLDALLTRKRKLNRAILAPSGTTNSDFSELFKSTVEDVRGAPFSEDEELDLNQIDLMEPLAFEDWVLRELTKAGYDARRTPWQDGGADGVAIYRLAGVAHTLLIQCKHTQSDHPCDHRSVEEVFGALSRYKSVSSEKVCLIVVTNAKSFTKGARRLAEERNVDLIARDNLELLRKYKSRSL